jgi:hypothetical protein
VAGQVGDKRQDTVGEGRVEHVRVEVVPRDVGDVGAHSDDDVTDVGADGGLGLRQSDDDGQEGHGAERERDALHVEHVVGFREHGDDDGDEDSQGSHEVVVRHVPAAGTRRVGVGAGLVDVAQADAIEATGVGHCMISFGCGQLHPLQCPSNLRVFWYYW